MKSNATFHVLLAILTITASAQDIKEERTDKLYSSSGIGFSIPIGETSEYFAPKVSTTLGLNLGLGNKGLFLYPKISLHAYKYNQQITDPGYTTKINNGRATTYLLNLALGYRKIVGNFGYYGFIGGGGGFILTPEVQVNTPGTEASLNNKTNSMVMLETGLGIEYNIGKLSVFLESSFMNGFSKIQERRFQSIPLSIGIKPNLSSKTNGKK